jgi:hypothetical protein
MDEVKTPDSFDNESLRLIVNGLISESNKNTSKGDLIKFELPMGEVDGGYDDEQIIKIRKAVLNWLIEEKVLESFYIKCSTEDYGTDELFIATAECKLSRKGLQNFLHRYSYIPKLQIKQDNFGYIVLQTATEEIRIRNPRSSSGPFLFWKCVLKNPNRLITKEKFDAFVIEVCEIRPKNLNPVFRKIVEDYGFSGNLKKLFFPSTSMDGVIFMNPIYERDIKALALTDTKLNLSVKKLKEQTKAFVRKGKI